jgi:hypothetical protein
VETAMISKRTQIYYNVMFGLIIAILLVALGYLLWVAGVLIWIFWIALF